MGLAELNGLTVDQLKNLKQTINFLIDQKAGANLSVGAKVTFEGRGGMTVEGTVLKINKKNVKVDCGSHGRWNVAKSLLKLV